MTTLAELVDGIAATLSTIPVLRVTDHVPSDTEYPAAFVVPPEIDYQRAMKGGMIHCELDVIILVGAVLDRQQKDLFRFLDWLGPSSVYYALAQDPTLGLANVRSKVSAARPLGEDEMAGYRSYGAAVRVIMEVTNPAA